jgi:F0F1-type ATP synthase assembly protein I
MADDDRPQETKVWALYASIGQIGLEMVLPIALGLLIDYWLGTLPWIGVVGVFVGFIGGFLHLLNLLKKIDRNNPPKPPQGQA